MTDTAEAQRKLAAIMFTDMVGYSALAQRNEARAIELLEEHRRVVRGILPPHGGREVKTTGDGFLLEFPSALAAVQAAVGIQQALHERNQTVPPDRQVNIRIGIHLGDVVLFEGDIHGDGVNIAARLEPLAAPGGICISSAVWEQVRNKVDHPLALLGPAELKNIELPVVVHRVVMPWESRTAGSRTAGTRARPRSAFWLAGLAALALLAALVAGLTWRRVPSGRAQAPADAGVSAPPLESAGTVLFQTGFERPACQPGALAGQDGWVAGGDFSREAARVVATTSGQEVTISGTALERVNSNLWSAILVHRLTNALALPATAYVSVEAQLQFDLGSAPATGGFLAASLMLGDGTLPFAAVGLNRAGAPFGQNFDRPNKHVSTARGANPAQRLKADFDFANRTASFYADGRFFGTVPFNPNSGGRLEGVSFGLQSDHPVDSILRVDNLVVRLQAAPNPPPPAGAR